MRLPFSARHFLATAIAASLALDEMAIQSRRTANDPTFRGWDVLERVVQGVRFVSEADEAAWSELKIHDSFARRNLGQFTEDPSHWTRTTDEAAQFLKARVERTLAGRAALQRDALLILLYVWNRDRKRHQPNAIDCGELLGLDDEDVTELARSQSLRGQVVSDDDGTLRITFDGKLAVEESLQEEDPAQEAAVQSPPQRSGMTAVRVAGQFVRVAFSNVLSFGPEPVALDLHPLNLLVGANGSGKSNLIQAIALLASTAFPSEPRDLVATARELGGIDEVLFKSRERGAATFDATIRMDHRENLLRHTLSITAAGQRLAIADERVENADAQGHAKPFFFFGYEPGGAKISAVVDAGKRRLESIRLAAGRSILSALRDPNAYPEIHDLGSFYEQIAAYRDPLVGRRTPPRVPQAADLPSDRLDEDARNLAMVLQRLSLDTATHRKIVDLLREVYEPVVDVKTSVIGGTIQTVLMHDAFPVSSLRISDGTLRFLCLLVVLCDPTPPPVILLEEPELGLHPDAIGIVADLLREASTRAQVIVTTHSVALVDRFTQTPESVLVVDKHEGATQIARLDRDDLREWLSEYSLGKLWRMGRIGGNRW